MPDQPVDSADHAHRGGRKSFLTISEWSLRRKVALAVTIPLLLAGILGGLRVNGALDHADNYSASARQVTVLRPAVTYLAAAEHAVVVAREKTTVDDPDRDAAVAAVEAAGAQLERARATEGLTPEQRAQIDTILDLSVQLRNGGAYVSVGQSVSQLRQLQRGVTELINTIIAEQLEPQPGLPLLEQAMDGRLSLAMQQFQVAYNDGADAKRVELASELGVEAAAIERLGAGLGQDNEQVQGLRNQNAFHFGVVRDGDTDLGGEEAYVGYDEVTEDLLNDVDAELAQAADESRNAALLNSAITMIALLAAILLAVLVSRMLLHPIRRVREGALAVAQEQLPDAVAKIRAGEDPGEIVPIDVTTHEEMGQLARAVDAMHQEAVNLAEGEAQVRAQVGEMFVTLSRRNTSLINQQLGLIEALEKDEEDPRRLDSLFRLDHLASRMRRTAESLMVLADAPTHTTDQGGLSLTDTLQAAIAGVQEYQRVQIVTTPTERLSGTAVSDVVHLLTELVDNALAYSPPTAPVLVLTKPNRDGTVIEISDGGLGIAPDELAALNADLRSEGEVTLETARRMGLLVVSRLARRHGMTVGLSRNDRGGTTATVTVPRSILQERAASTPAKAAANGLHTPASPSAPEPAAHQAPVVPPAERVVDAPAADAQPAAAAGLDSIEAAINAVIRLPQRKPTTGDPLEVDKAASLEPATLEGLEDLSARAAAPALASAVSPIPAATTAYSVLDPKTPVPESANEETSIFHQMRSNWFSADGSMHRPWTTTEVEAGWEVADRVAETPAAEVTDAGLPVRRPGNRLVPGGVTSAETPAARDPEAIRARLAAHAAGVSRGRSKTNKHKDRSEQEAGPR